MINNNIILTVSYGTFSCTLEGFDDSFGTMKAIAEYFRDLSADDRYFGAEPAQPDAQMLARIAEREISRHVEAREDKGRIVLSAQSTPNEAAALVASDAVEDVADAIADAALSEAVEVEADEAAPAEATDADEASQEEAPASTLVAPKVKVVVKTPAPAAIEPAPQAKAEPAARETPAQTEAKDETAPRVIVPSLPDEEVEAFFADSTTTSIQEDIAEDDFEDDVVPAQERAKADSIADKLKRIRAVVSQQGEAVASPDYSEDQHADATVAPAAKITDTIADEADVEAEDETSEAVLANTLRDLEDALDADDEAEVAYTDEDAFDDDDESEDDDITAILNRLERDAEVDEDEDYDEEHDDDFTDEDDDSFEDDDMGGNILAAMDTVQAATDDTDLTDENLFEEVAEADEGEASNPSLRKAPLAEGSSLSDEAEEALARELTALEADMEAGTDDAFEDAYDDEDAFEDEAAVAPVEQAPEETTPTARTRIPASADEDFSRLMEESEQQMEEPEAATRRDAFAHLRAAVAAKKADEAIGGADADDETDETDEACRDDLASVVRPRRPASSDRTRTERPAEARPAPLKLVAEQRIDTAEPRSVTPVRPRRVAAVVAPAAIEDTPQAEGFANFADEMGATKLPDLLEAAAAYLSFVEGHEQFSRPQLMTKVRQVEKENFTREDSLRSFGKLLREGKIEKMKGGRFQASEQIGFKPAKRAAG